MQRRHSLVTLARRTLLAAGSNLATAVGLYPALPHALLIAERGRTLRAPVRTALAEIAISGAAAVARPLGHLPLPGHHGHGPRPIILVHGFAMNRANFWLLARRLASAGLGPIYGFEYWTLGKAGVAARELAAFVDQVRTATGAAEVDVIGHSMGGLVARYFAAFVGGDGAMRHLVTIGSPHGGTPASHFGVGAARKELLTGSALVARLAAAPPLARTQLLVIWSRGDALVPSTHEARIPGAEEIVYDDLGHLGLLISRRVAADVIARLRP